MAKVVLHRCTKRKFSIGDRSRLLTQFWCQLSSLTTEAADSTYLDTICTFMTFRCHNPVMFPFESHASEHVYALKRNVEK